MSFPFDVTALNAALGAYARDNSKQIFMDAIYEPSESKKTTVWDLMSKVVVWDELAYGTADFEPEVQDAANNFNAQGDFITIGGQTLKMRYMRSDFQIKYRGLYNTWLNHIEQESYKNRIKKGDIKAAEMAFGKWIFENMAKKFMEKFRLQTSFLGEYNAAYTTANSFDHAADGILKQVTDAITSGDIPAGNVTSVVGPLALANTFDHYEAMGEALPPKFYNKPMCLLASVKNSRFYNKGYKAANGGNNVNIYDAYKRVELEEADNVKIIPVPEMGTRDTSLITPPDNMIWATNFDSKPPEILTSPSGDPMIINCTLLYGAAFGFKRIDHVYPNDL